MSDNRRGEDLWMGGRDRYPSEKPGEAGTFDSSPSPLHLDPTYEAALLTTKWYGREFPAPEEP